MLRRLASLAAGGWYSVGAISHANRTRPAASTSGGRVAYVRCTFAGLSTGAQMILSSSCWCLFKYQGRYYSVTFIVDS